MPQHKYSYNIDSSTELLKRALSKINKEKFDVRKFIDRNNEKDTIKRTDTAIIGRKIAWTININLILIN